MSSAPGGVNPNSASRSRTSAALTPAASTRARAGTDPGDGIRRAAERVRSAAQRAREAADEARDRPTWIASAASAPPENGLGWVYLKLGRRAESRAAFERALALRPGYTDALDGLRLASQ
ncbi:MAG: tetratricopeptide repeat protein [Candidatus Rokuibacteriota bacterium]